MTCSKPLKEKKKRKKKIQGWKKRVLVQPGPLRGDKRQRCQRITAQSSIAWIVEGDTGGQEKIQKIEMKNENQ